MNEFPANVVVSHIIGKYLDGVIHRFERSPAKEFDFSPTEISHQILNALVASGYLIVDAPTVEDAVRHPSCWVAKPAETVRA